MSFSREKEKRGKKWPGGFEIVTSYLYFQVSGANRNVSQPDHALEQVASGLYILIDLWRYTHCPHKHVPVGTCTQLWVPVLS